MTHFLYCLAYRNVFLYYLYILHTLSQRGWMSYRMLLYPGHYFIIFALSSDRKHSSACVTDSVSFLDPPVVHNSCKNRCYEPFDEEILGCRCDQQCNGTNSCCYDFQDICLQPSKRPFMSENNLNIICLLYLPWFPVKGKIKGTMRACLIWVISFYHEHNIVINQQ